MDPERFLELWGRHQRLLRRCVLTVVPWWEVDDVMQKVALRLLQLEEEPAHAGFLKRAARWEALTHRKQFAVHRHRFQAIGPKEYELAEEPEERFEYDVEAALAILTARERRCVDLWMAGERGRDAAKKLGVTYGSYRVKLYRALERLRERMVRTDQ